MPQLVYWNQIKIEKGLIKLKVFICAKIQFFLVFNKEDGRRMEATVAMFFIKEFLLK